MTDRDQRERLFDQLWPCPPPRPDLADRVLAQLERSGDSGRVRTGPRALPPLPPLPPPSAPATTPAAAAGTVAVGRRGRARLLAAALSMSAVAAACLAVAWWGDFGGQGSITAQGQQVAGTRMTVSIADRAAAAMEPGSDLAWSVRKRRVRVDQRRGSVFYRVDRGGPFRVTTPAGDVEVTGTCFRVSMSAVGKLSTLVTLVSVLEGSVKVSTGSGGQRAVHAGETVRLQHGQPPTVVAPASGDSAQEQAKQQAEQQLRERAAAAEARLRALEQQLAAHSGRRQQAAPLPPRAALLLPPSTRLRVHGSRLQRVSLAVPSTGPTTTAAEGAAQVAVEVEVARDPGFKQKIFSGPTRAPYVTVAAPARGDLYWRLAGSTQLAGHARFVPDRRRSPLQLRRPHNVVNQGAQNTTIYFQGAAPAVTLAFAETPGARGYRIRIYGAADPRRPIFERTVPDTSCPVEPGVFTEGRFQWSAQPVDERGQPLGEGRLNRLELAYDNALEDLAISRPLPNQKQTGKAVRVAGVAPLGGRLFVNGTPAALDDKGRFSLQLGGAPRVLVFRLLGSDGAESYWIRTLRSRS